MQDLEDLWDKLTLPEKEMPKETSSIHEIDKGLFMFDRFWICLLSASLCINSPVIVEYICDYYCLYYAPFIFKLNKSIVLSKR